MSWYQAFNLLEGVLWWVVSLTIFLKVPRATPSQFWGAMLAVASFFAFGVTDIIESFNERRIPLWLWGFKVLCGVGIFCSRYTWRGWSTFCWTDREFLFGLMCLIMVACLICFQLQMNELHVGNV